eukprot:PRCOL_00006207-RA
MSGGSSRGAGAGLQLDSGYDAPVDFAALAERDAALREFMVQGTGARARPTFDFRAPGASAALCRALLAQRYGVRWELPPARDFLVPAVPNRANYLRWLSGLVGMDARVGEGGMGIHGVDVGCGASCIYSLLAASRYGWHMVGLERCAEAADVAAANAARNAHLRGSVRVRRTCEEREVEPAEDAAGGGGGSGGRAGAAASATAAGARADVGGRGSERPLGRACELARVPRGAIIGGGALPPASEVPYYAVTLCNPPFFESPEQWRRNARDGFGGTAAEMVCDGGEAAFVRAMARESAEPELRARVGWFTTLIGRKANLAPLARELRGERGAACVRTTTFEQGKTHRWGLAWTYSEDIARRAELEERAQAAARREASGAGGASSAQAAGGARARGARGGAKKRKPALSARSPEARRGGRGGARAGGRRRPRLCL